MIDFTKLKQTNPISFRLFESWIEKQHGTTLLFFTEKITNEEIIEFLDKNDIFVNICGCAKVWQSKTYTHIDGIYGEIDNLNFSKSRIGCSEKAIEVAFELLETKLKTN